MKKTLVLLASMVVCSMAFASAPKTNNHGFVFETTPQATVVAEQEVAQPQAVEVVAPQKEVKAQKATKSAQKAKLTKEEKKAVKSLVKEIRKSEVKPATINAPANEVATSATNVDQAVLVILAIFIPFVAVLLNNGVGTEFWIDLILTILGWIPGMIYALLLVLGLI